MTAPPVVNAPDCALCCPEPCCNHSSAEYGHCSDCLDTGHAHRQCQPCPNCSDSPGDDVGHVPADDVACSVCGFDVEAAAEQENPALDHRTYQTGF